MKLSFCNYFWKTLEEAFSPDRESLNQACVREVLQTHPTLLHPALPQRLASKDHLNLGSYGGGEEVRGQGSTRPSLRLPTSGLLPSANSHSFLSLVPALTCPW